MILTAPGWPNMPWFWDLVNLSLQIPFRLPLTRDLLTQPFNGLLHRNLNNLNLHAWLLESLPFRNTGSLMKWQQELRLLREAQPEPYISQSGPFFLNGASRTRWTSGRPLGIKLRSFFYCFNTTFSKREICSPVSLRATEQPLQTW